MFIDNITKFKKDIFILLSFFILSRLFYYKFLNIEFDTWTIDLYWQYFPKDLLKNDLINSLIHNHNQAPFLNLMVGLMMKITNKYLILIQLIYLTFGFLSFLFIYFICREFNFKEKISLIITIILMIFPTTILYENHLYKEYLTFFFLVYLFYCTIKLNRNYDSFNYVFFISLSLSLLCITRETFHIYWGYVFIFLIIKNFTLKNKIYLILIFTIIVSPFYIKNLILFNKFGLSVAGVYEHLSQKVDYVKEMKDPKRHVSIRNYTFGTYENYQRFKKRGSILYDEPLYLRAHEYQKILNHKNKSDNKLLNSNTIFNEVYFEVEKHRKKDFFLIFKEHPSLFFLNISNSLLRHLFFSSDYFSFTKPNAEKMKPLIKLSDCIKLTPICIYEFNFKKKISSIGKNSYYSVDTGFLSYYEKIIYSFQHTNFLLVIIYISLLIYLTKNIFFLKKLDIIDFWLLTFGYIFAVLIVFEDGEISRHRFPIDYLSFLIFLKISNFRFLKK